MAAGRGGRGPSGRLNFSASISGLFYKYAIRATHRSIANHSYLANLSCSCMRSARHFRHLSLSLSCTTLFVFPIFLFFSNSLPDNDYRALSRLNAAARIIKIVTRLAGKSGLAIAIDSLAFSFPLTGKPWRCSRGIRRDNGNCSGRSCGFLSKSGKRILCSFPVTRGAQMKNR